MCMVPQSQGPCLTPPIAQQPVIEQSHPFITNKTLTKYFPGTKNNNESNFDLGKVTLRINQLLRNYHWCAALFFYVIDPGQL